MFHQWLKQQTCYCTDKVIQNLHYASWKCWNHFWQNAFGEAVRGLTRNVSAHVGCEFSVQVHVCMFSLPALWVTGLLLCASAHWVRRKKLEKTQSRGGEKAQKMAGETASITTAGSTAHIDSLQCLENLASHKSSIIQTSVTGFHSSAVTIPHTKFGNLQLKRAHALQPLPTPTVTSTSLKKLCTSAHDIHLILSYSRWPASD